MTNKLTYSAKQQKEKAQTKGYIMPATTAAAVDDKNLSQVFNEEAQKLSQNLYEVLIGDVGTGDVGITKFLFDPETGIVYGEKKFDIKKGNDAKAFADTVATYLNHPDRINIRAIINMTSSSRNPNAFDQEIIDELTKIQDVFAGKVVNILSQTEEAEVGDLSRDHIITHKNPKLTFVTPEKSIQFEGGKGSAQSAALLPEQMEEKGGNWASNLLNTGKTLKEIAKAFEIDTASMLNAPSEELAKKKVVIMHGIFAVGLQDKELFPALGISQNEAKDWGTIQIPRTIGVVIGALEGKVNQSDVALNEKLLQALNNEEIIALLNVNVEHEDEEVKREDSIDRQALLAFIATEPTLDGVSVTAKALLQQIPDFLTAADKAIPAVLALGALKALRERHENIKTVLNAKDPIGLFKEDGTQLAEAKLTGSHGAAVKHFRDIGLRANKKVNTQLVGLEQFEQSGSSVTFHLPTAKKVVDAEQKTHWKPANTQQLDLKKAKWRKEGSQWKKRIGEKTVD